MNTKPTPASEGLTLHLALARFIQQLDADGRSRHTRAQYARHLRLFIDWVEETRAATSLDDLRPDDLAAFFQSDRARTRAQSGRKSAATLNALRTSLRCFFAYCHAAEWTARNPAKLLRRAQTRPPSPRPLPTEDRDRLLRTLDTAATKEERRDRLLFRLLLLAGLRIGSAVALDVEDLDLEEGEVQLRSLKGGGADRALLPDTLIEDLRDFLADRQSGPLFTDRLGRRISIRQAQRRFSGWLDRAGITRRTTPHALRHSFATRLYEKTGDINLVRTALNHRNIESTLVYASCDRERLRNAL